MTKLKFQEDGTNAVFTAKIVPASSKTAIAGVLDGMLKIKVAAPAEKGKANKSIIEFLSKELSVRKNRIEIIAGQTNPVKQIRISDISVDEILSRLNLNQ